MFFIDFFVTFKLQFQVLSLRQRAFSLLAVSSEVVEIFHSIASSSSCNSRWLTRGTFFLEFSNFFIYHIYFFHNWCYFGSDDVSLFLEQLYLLIEGVSFSFYLVDFFAGLSYLLVQLVSFLNVFFDLSVCFTNLLFYFVYLKVDVSFLACFLILCHALASVLLSRELILSFAFGIYIGLL